MRILCKFWHILVVPGFWPIACGERMYRMLNRVKGCEKQWVLKRLGQWKGMLTDNHVQPKGFEGATKNPRNSCTKGDNHPSKVFLPWAASHCVSTVSTSALSQWFRASWTTQFATWSWSHFFRCSHVSFLSPYWPYLLIQHHEERRLKQGQVSKNFGVPFKKVGPGRFRISIIIYIYTCM